MPHLLLTFLCVLGGLFVLHGCRLDQWHHRWISLENWPGDGDPSISFPVLWTPSWWLVGPELLNYNLAWPRTLYWHLIIHVDSEKSALTHCLLTLQYLSSFFLSIFFFFVFLKSSLLPLMPFSYGLLLCPLALPVDLSSINPHSTVILLPCPHRLLLSEAQIWSLLDWVSCCWNHRAVLDPF